MGKLEGQDPLEELNLAKEGEKPKFTYMSDLLEDDLEKEIINIL